MNTPSGPLRRAEWALLLGLVLTGAYLWLRDSASLPYIATILLHPLFGVGLAATLAWRLRRGLPRSVSWLMVALSASAATGVTVMITGGTRPYRWIVDTHAAASAIALVLAVAWLWRHRHVSPRWNRAATTAGAALFLIPLAVAGMGLFSSSTDRVIVNPTKVPTTMDEEGGGAKGPFFPSSATTTTGGTIPESMFLSSKSCGRCHKDIYAQWQSSAHHFSSFNNQWYRKAIEYMQDVVGTRPSKWCAGCHDHALLFPGNFDAPMKGRMHTPAAQAGLGCMSCHAIVHVKSTMGQGDFVMEYPPLHDLATSTNPVMQLAHDYVLKLDPAPHRVTFLKDIHRGQSEFCSACHKVHLDVPVNDYRWLRGFNEYDNWQASGVSGQGARSFYLPPKGRVCHDCHMPLVASNDPGGRNGYIHSHRFPAANTAVPTANEDKEQLKVVQDFLEDRQVTIDIFGIVRGDEGRFQGAEERQLGEGARLASTFAVGEEAMNAGPQRAVVATPTEVVGPLGHVIGAVRRGESVRVEVVVRTRNVGHFFPGGTVDAFDVWVELEAVDSNGRLLFHSGGVADHGRGPVDLGAHFYKSLMLDDHGNPINKRNAYMTRSVAYVRLIPPGAADTIHYRLLVPKDCGDRITLRARLNYRKFAWWTTQWAFAGVRDPKDVGFSLTHGHDDGRWLFTGSTADVSAKTKKIPNLPITVMSHDEQTLQVLPADAALPGPRVFLERSVRERWNDYGIGLLLQGDLKGAEAAFLHVTEMEPEYVDGWVNVARARLKEGDVDGAKAMLQRAFDYAPDLAKTHFFMASALKSQGRYDEALTHAREASRQYPRDRVILNLIARLLFLKREYAQSVQTLHRVLAIDPEDLQAHYNLMLCYRGLRDRDSAARERRLYQRFKADEASQTITGGYRKLHPQDNNERQAIHEHVSDSQPGEVAADYAKEIQG